MPPSMTGRRVAGFEDLERAGDYCGPFEVDDKLRVWFLLPIARDEGVPASARSIRFLTSPPHVLRECTDGSLEVRESIGAGIWHGYLDEGNNWRAV